MCEQDKFPSFHTETIFSNVTMQLNNCLIISIFSSV